MIKFSPNLRVSFSGDKQACQNPALLGQARQQLAVLKNAMSFQDLKQGRMNRAYAGGIQIFCASIFGIDVIKIHVPQVSVYVEKPEQQRLFGENYHFILVCGDPMERLTLSYEEDSPLFHVGEGFSCSDGGGGTVAAVSGNKIWSPEIIKCWDMGVAVNGSQGALATVNDCTSRIYSGFYSMQEVENHSGPQFYDLDPVLPNIYCPADFTDAGAVDCHTNSSTIKPRTWSKTYDAVTVTAFLHGTTLAPVWSIAATYYGDHCLIAGGNQFGGASRYGYTSSGDQYTAFKGFDVWKDGDEYRIGYISDAGTLYVFGLNEETGNFSLISELASSAVDEETNNRLVGYHEYTAYWCSYKTKYYYKDDFKNGGFSRLEKGDRIHDSLWNPVNETLYLYAETYKTITPLENSAPVAIFINAYTYYMSNFCEVFIDGSYNGDACKYKTFIGDPAAVTLTAWWGDTVGATIYTESSSQYNTKTINDVTAADYVERQDQGDVFIGEYSFSRGRTKNSSGRRDRFSNTTRVMLADGAFSTCEPDSFRAAYAKETWHFDYSGTAGRYRRVNYQSVRRCDDNGNDTILWTMCVPEYVEHPSPVTGCLTQAQMDAATIDWTYHNYGDSDIRALAGDFPNENWQALLKHGIDREGRELGRIIVYPGFLKCSKDDQRDAVDYEKDRVFFTAVKREWEVDY